MSSTSLEICSLDNGLLFLAPTSFATALAGAGRFEPAIDPDQQPSALSFPLMYRTYLGGRPLHSLDSKKKVIL